jgi:D-3-phosphoglycerate dehydrogenase
VITDSDSADIDVETSLLANYGIKVSKHHTCDESELIRITENADAIITDFAPIGRRVISNLRRCKVIIADGVGYDNIDVKAATEKKILVCNVPDYLTYEVADHTLSLILSLVRKIPWANELVKSGEWTTGGTSAWKKLKPIMHLDGRTAGIVGFGRIGRQIADRLQAFKMNVIASDPNVRKELAAESGVELVDLSTLLENADIISVNTILSKDTFHLIGKEQLKLMKPSAIIVNTSRGKVIDQSALVEALKDGRIAAAGLDVLETEPPELNDQILGLENVLLTPHLGGTSDKAVEMVRRLATEEARRVLMGESPKHPINSEFLKRP